MESNDIWYKVMMRNNMSYFFSEILTSHSRWINPRKNFKCGLCRSDCPKGTMCVGDSTWSHRFCFNCVSTSFKQVKKDIDDWRLYFNNDIRINEQLNLLKDIIERLENEYDENKMKWSKKAILNKLEN